MIEVVEETEESKFAASLLDLARDAMEKNQHEPVAFIEQVGGNPIALPLIQFGDWNDSRVRDYAVGCLRQFIEQIDGEGPRVHRAAIVSDVRQWTISKPEEFADAGLDPRARHTWTDEQRARWLVERTGVAVVVETRVAAPVMFVHFYRVDGRRTIVWEELETVPDVEGGPAGLLGLRDS